MDKLPTKGNVTHGKGGISGEGYIFGFTYNLFHVEQ